MARDSYCDEGVGGPCDTSARNGGIARSPAAPHLMHTTVLRPVLADQACNSHCKLVTGALLRPRQGGLACNLRSGAALWLHSSARIQMTLGPPKWIARACTCRCAISGRRAAPRRGHSCIMDAGGMQKWLDFDRRCYVVPNECVLGAASHTRLRAGLGAPAL